MILTEDQQQMRDVARRFAQDKLAPGYQQRDRQDRIDRGLLQEMGALGLIGADLPEDYGGMAVPGTTAGVILEQIAYGDFNVSYVQLMASLMGSIIVRHAPREAAAHWVPRIIAGEALCALGLTEPRGGSDAANLALKAERSGDDFILNGEKTSISFAAQADVIVVFARTGGPTEGARGVSAFLVPLTEKGISRTSFDDFGTRVVGRGSIFFDNVRVPAGALLGDLNRGFSQVMQGFDYSRALIGLQCIAAAQASLDESWQYITERQAFGAPLAQYQGVSFPLSESEALLAACRALCYQTISLRDAGLPHTAEAAMCKWLAPKTAVDVIHQCLLTHGHSGYANDLPHQQRLRDVIGLEIGDGTAQIMKLIVAREKVGRVAVQYGRK